MPNLHSRDKFLENASFSAAPCLKHEELYPAIKKGSLPYPPGLTNLGNTCYINATLQCLLTIQPLVDWLISQSKETQCHSSSSDVPRLTPILSKLVVAIFKHNYDSELEQFRHDIGKLVKDFKEPREQDAQEFLLFLLNRLHDETAQNTNSHGSPTSEILRIFEGTLQTQLLCLRCASAAQKESKHKSWFFRSTHKEPKGNSEVFLSLSVPIPVPPNQIEAAVDSVDSNACELNVLFHMAIDSSLCSRYLLKLHQNTDIQSVYNHILSFSSLGSNNALTSTSYASRPLRTTVIECHQGLKGCDREGFSVSAASDSFLLVQAKSTGFGEWFLESSGRAVDLTDGLNVEGDASASLQSLSKSVIGSLLTGDALFIVRLSNEHIQQSPSNLHRYSSSSSFPQDETIIVGVEAGQQTVESFSSNAVERSMQLLVLHVEEGERNRFANRVFDNSTRAACFRRFSLPFSINVPIDIHFENLCCFVKQSLFGVYDYSMFNGACQSVRFWVVDAAPGEPCEIDSRQEFPLLHSTVEVSSIPMPEWLSADNVDRPRLLRLLVVWPTRPSDLPSLRVTIETPSRKHSTSSGAAANSNTPYIVDGNSRLSKSKNSVHTNMPPSSGLTITKCLEEFIKTTNVSNIEPFECPKCKKLQTSAVLDTKLLKPPICLLLHLNRFVHVPAPGGGSRLMKINSLVDYPINGLDLSFMFEPPTDKKSGKTKKSSKSDVDQLVYELVAVCNHKGSIETGHITAYCKSLVSDQWWHYNDLKVQKVSPDQVVQPGAYILFYQKRGADVGNISETVHNLMRLSNEVSNHEVSNRVSSTLPPVDLNQYSLDATNYDLDTRPPRLLDATTVSRRPHK